MRISGQPYLVDLSGVQKLPQPGAPAAAQQTPPPAPRRSFDRVELSAAGQQMDRLKRDLSALPDVRLDRVALAKQNLQGGGYRLDPTVLAQKMMDSFATQ